MMMPPTMLVPHEDLLYPTQSSPELRRMDMFNRARREEMETMITGVSPRHGMRTVGARRDANDSLTASRFFHGLRNGIGNVLITAGNRIQNPA